MLSLQKENLQLFNKLVYIAKSPDTSCNVDKKSRTALEYRVLVRPFGNSNYSYVPYVIKDVLSSALMDENGKVPFSKQLEEHHVYTLRSPFKHKNSN